MYEFLYRFMYYQYLLQLPFHVPFPGQCDLYGQSQYISFQGVTFNFLNQCTYILVEERSPRHNLTIAVDNFNCVPGLQESCAKDIILRYQSNVAKLSIVPHLSEVQVGNNTNSTDLSYLHKVPQ